MQDNTGLNVTSLKLTDSEIENWTDAQYQSWLNGLQAGDNVVCCGYRKEVRKVSSSTAKLIYVSGVRYRKAQLCRYDLCPITIEFLRELKRTKAENSLRKAVYDFKDYTNSGMSCLSDAEIEGLCTELIRIKIKMGVVKK